MFNSYNFTLQFGNLFSDLILLSSIVGWGGKVEQNTNEVMQRDFFFSFSLVYAVVVG